MRGVTGSSACEQAIRLLAVRAQGAPAGSLRRARAHVVECPRCSALVDDTGAADVALAALRREQSLARVLWRISLAGLALVQLVLSLPWLLGTSPLVTFGGYVEASHLTRDGAFGVVIGTAGLLTAWRQRYALGAFAVSVVVMVTQVGAAVADALSDHVHASFEVVHVLPLAITLLILVGRRRDRLPRNADPPRAPVHLV